MILLQEAWVCFRVVRVLDCHILDICGNVFRVKLISWQSVIAESSQLPVLLLCFLACFLLLQGHAVGSSVRFG